MPVLPSPAGPRSVCPLRGAGPARGGGPGVLSPNGRPAGFVRAVSPSGWGRVLGFPSRWGLGCSGFRLGVIACVTGIFQGPRYRPRVLRPRCLTTKTVGAPGAHSKGWSGRFFSRLHPPATPPRVPCAIGELLGASPSPLGTFPTTGPVAAH